MNMYSDRDGPLLAGFAHADGRTRVIGWEELEQGSAAVAGERRWLHLNRNSASASAWLSEEQSVPLSISRALFQEDTRPRAVVMDNGLLINLRGVNFNEGMAAEDMVSVRLWVTPELIVTTSAQRTLALDDLKQLFVTNRVPESQGDIIAFIADRLTARLEPLIGELVEEVTVQEESLLNDQVLPKKAALAAFRRRVLTLRRYMAPQREAISALLRDGGRIIEQGQNYRLRDIYDDVTRLAEELDMIRERAVVLQEQLVEHRAEEMNKRLFLLAIVSAVFLPLGFLTGLFGVNVGGMPGVDSPVAFTVLTLGLIGLMGGLLYIFHRLDWW